jgi:hypothetical protein
MSAPHPDQAFITDRQNKIIQAWATESLEELLSFYFDDIKFSDFGLPLLPLSPNLTHLPPLNPL